MHKLLRFFSIRFLLKTTLLVWIIRLMLWLLPFSTVRNFVDRLSTGSVKSRKPGQQSLNKIAQGVIFASRYVPMATCLTQALTTMVIMGRCCYPARLQIGVARSEKGEFEAHAWVESEGVIVIGGSKSKLDRYTPLWAFNRSTL